MSLPATAARMASLSLTGSSGTGVPRVATAPHSLRYPARIRELNSMIWPGWPIWPGWISSLPVGMAIAFGGHWTQTFVTPVASIAPWSIGRTWCPSGRISSVATMSSPMVRTCCHGVAGRISSTSSSLT